MEQEATYRGTVNPGQCDHVGMRSAELVEA